MAPAKPTDAHVSGSETEPPIKPKKKKPKSKPRPAADYEIKPAAQATKSSGVSTKPQTAGSGSGPDTANKPAAESGHATGHYRVLLESRSVETLCRSLPLQYRHLAQLHRLFQREDDYNTGEITIDEFFHAIGDEKRQLTLGIFRYVGLDPTPRRLTFDHFVLCIVTFAALSRKELLHYAFTLFDKDESGMMDMKELGEFYGGLKNKNAFFFQKNVDIAQQRLAAKDHKGPGARPHAGGAAGSGGLVDFEDVQEGSSKFQIAFFPLIQFQRNIQVAALGEAFWTDIVSKKSLVERIVHYMRLHDGHLPSLPLGTRLLAMAKYTAFLLTGGGTTTVFSGGPIAARQAAITKYAEEMRQRKLEEEALKVAKEEEKRLVLAEQEAAEGTNGGDKEEEAIPVRAYSPVSGTPASSDPVLEEVKNKTDKDATPKKKKKTPKKTKIVVE